MFQLQIFQIIEKFIRYDLLDSSKYFEELNG